MSEYFLFYDTASGALEGRGMGPDGTAALQVPPFGCAMLVVPQAIWETNPFDLAALAKHLRAQVDAEAEAFRAQFITPGAGQAMTYLRKEAEAAAYLADDTVPVPFLTAEAAATGVTVAALAAAVAAQAAAWLVVGPAIEGARIGAKKAIVQAGNIAAMHAAAQVDWAALVEG